MMHSVMKIAKMDWYWKNEKWLDGVTVIKNFSIFTDILWF